MADDTDIRLEISLDRQLLGVYKGGECLAAWPVSTALNGPGEQQGSECTPRGAHRIADCIGAGLPVGTVFVGREPTGEIYTDALGEAYPGRDWILTRILRLEGCEPGVNQGGDVDTYARYIYIHGTPDTVRLGAPGSHGCIRMGNQALIELYAMVRCGTPVHIE